MVNFREPRSTYRDPVLTTESLKITEMMQALTAQHAVARPVIGCAIEVTRMRKPRVAIDTLSRGRPQRPIGSCSACSVSSVLSVVRTGLWFAAR